jgi:small redox-active disulfide protein 2
LGKSLISIFLPITSTTIEIITLSYVICDKYHYCHNKNRFTILSIISILVETYSTIGFGSTPSGEYKMLTVKVLGPGCKNCTQLEEIVKMAVIDLGVEANVEKVSDYGEIMSYNVMATPGLVINDHVVSSGRIPSENEVMSWLTNA